MDMELICMQIITSSGLAKSNYIEAMTFARKFEFDKAYQLIEEGKQEYLKAHKAHSELLTKEMSGDKVPMSLILMHAEDQLMAADSFKLVCEENIELIKTLKKAIDEK